MGNSAKITGTSADPESLLAQELAETRQQFQDLQAHHMALFKLTQLSHDCADLSVFFQEVHQTIASLMTAKNFYIVMYDETLATLEFVYHVDEKDEIPEGTIAYEEFAGSLTNYVIETAQPLLATPELITELTNNRKIAHIGTLGLDWLGVPLINDGIVIGVMVVQSYSESTRYQERDLDLLTFAAQHIVVAMTRLQDRERLQNAVSARTRELMQQIREREKSELLQESLFRISELTNDVSLDIEQFYAQVHNIVGQLINAVNFFIAKYDKENETLEFVYYLDQNSRDLEKDFRPRKLANHYTELVIRRGETVLLHRDDMMALHESGETRKPQDETNSWLGVPLFSFGEILGVMVIQSYQQNTVYTEQDAELLNFVSQHVSTAIKRREAADYERRAHELLEQQVKLRTVALEDEIKQRKQAEERLKHTASHDSLTGLPNRSVFIDLLNHAIACRKRDRQAKFAVLFLDLDRFKVVNDSLGHHAGDILLKMIAKELREIVREVDTVARLGGDEFVILIENLISEQEAHEISSRITRLLDRPFTIEGQPVFIGTSIGLLFSDDRYDNADTMLRDADTAMYHAKDNGKGRYEVFDASMHSKVQNALSLEVDIREAIGAQEFVPYFQPIMNLSSGKIAGFEALARWNSAKRGFVYPDEFIPLAEDTNLVMAIDLQIMEKACLQLKQWQSKLQDKSLYVSCNLFCNHFFNKNLAQDISEILDRVGLSPQQLRVEITERALLENSDQVLANMQSLKQLGVKILLDDFGTGYSSLSYLHRFPIDVLKIDKSFINNVDEDANHRAIIKTIIDLATSLKMATVGEGIENVVDALLLQQMDCMYGQGYYFARPMAADAVETFMYSAGNPMQTMALN
ncbi:EAL domain-containing protein [Thalassomonas actiniarum]|uniref:EAL domain-containing protein n=2 Tax=Thalassomonas actiniarum TaxID=485447 RepID=A0AAF0C6C9_9GAMM|nr:EAL domain-containing protein [Thalassomonas actiniarum]